MQKYVNIKFKKKNFVSGWKYPEYPKKFSWLLIIVEKRLTKNILECFYILHARECKEFYFPDVRLK